MFDSSKYIKINQDEAISELYEYCSTHFIVPHVLNDKNNFNETIINQKQVDECLKSVSSFMLKDDRFIEFNK